MSFSEVVTDVRVWRGILRREVRYSDRIVERRVCSWYCSNCHLYCGVVVVLGVLLFIIIMDDKYIIRVTFDML